ncbi:MAG: GHKL domain-containing protein [Erysipelotrichaceae bacterium]|nr:GHKL domain-containing protein [Erysipelotrichaceae bacterium]MDY5251506.1 GHKL domain-containing protein [Erysipelotrichaceae bacterium]
MRVYILNQFILMALWAYYFNEALPIRKSWPKDLVYLYIGFLIHSMTSIWLFGHPGGPRDLPYLRMLVSLSTEILLLLIIKRSPMKKVFISCWWQLVFASLSELLAMCIVLVLNGFDTTNFATTINVELSTSLFNDLFFIIQVYIYLKFIRKKAPNREKDSFVIFLVLLTYQFMQIYMILYRIVDIPIPHFNLLMINMIIVVAVVDVVTMVVVIKIYRSMKKEKYLMMEQNVEQQMRHQFEQLLDKQQTMEEIYQEIVKSEDLLVHDLEYYSQELHDIRNKLYCDNPAINAMINYFADLFANEWIAFKVDINGSFQDIEAFFDINALLTNCLQNAYDECRGNDKMWVELAMVLKERVLIVQCRNSLNDHKLANNKKISGQGSKIIKEITDKYRGYADFMIDGDIACWLINITLPI